MYENSNLWEYHSLYKDLHDSKQHNNKPHNDSPLSDRVDEFFTTIPDERRFVHVTGSPSCSMKTDVQRCTPANSSDVIIAIVTSEEEDSSGTIEDEKEEESSAESNNDVTQSDRNFEQVQPSELSPKTQDTVQEPGKIIEIPPKASEAMKSRGKKTKNRKRAAEKQQTVI